MIIDAVEKASEAMDSASVEDMGPTEDTVQALLDYLVEPVLPLKSSIRVAPSQSQQQLVAKQVLFCNGKNRTFEHFWIRSRTPFFIRKDVAPRRQILLV